MLYLKKKLRNGMTLIFVPIENINIVSIGFFVKICSTNENNVAIAHLLEHVMFKSTKKRSAGKIFYDLDNIGAEYNGVTSFCYTYYYVSGKPNDIKLLLNIILDIFLNSHFNSKKINKEKNVVIEEIRNRSDTPMSKLNAMLNKKMFHGTYLEHKVTNEIEIISNITKSNLLKFKNKYYTPKNTVFVMTGNFNPFLVYKIINPILNNLKNIKNKNTQNILDSKQSYKTYNKLFEKSLILKRIYNQHKPYIRIKKVSQYQQTYLLLTFPLYDIYENKQDQIDLLSCLLTCGLSSRLKKALSEDHGLVYTLTSNILEYHGFALFLIYIIFNPDNLLKIIKILFSELRKIKNNIITNKELEKVKSLLLSKELYSLINPIDILIYFGINFLLNPNFDPESSNKRRKIRKITSKDIQSVAQEIFVYEKINLFILGNIKNIKNTNFNLKL